VTQGFVWSTLFPKYREEFYSTIPAKLASGEILYREAIYKGLEMAPQAMCDVQEGRNMGKTVVVVAAE
jgi:NADPH-dependent curcumin reductase CurA